MPGQKLASRLDEAAVFIKTLASRLDEALIFLYDYACAGTARQIGLPKCATVCEF